MQAACGGPRAGIIPAVSRLLIATLAGLLLAAPAGAGATAVPPHWESALPDAPPAGPQPRPVPGCRRATVRCIDVQLRRMRAAQDALGCDHRAVFATTYLTLTQQLRRAATRPNSIFLDRRYLFREVAVFASYYWRALRDDARGRRVPEAWRIAFATARGGEVNAGQDMLLGINAHVQGDMPFVLARMGLVDRRGRSRKPDHDAANDVLADAYQAVVDRVAQRYDPILRTTNASWNPFEDVAALEMVRGWRELVWRNAERLVAAPDAAARAEVARQIEAYAAAWARAIAATPQPGYRAVRDAYCAAGPAGKPAKTVASRST